MTWKVRHRGGLEWRITRAVARTFRWDVERLLRPSPNARVKPGPTQKRADATLAVAKTLHAASKAQSRTYAEMTDPAQRAVESAKLLQLTARAAKAYEQAIDEAVDVRVQQILAAKRRATQAPPV